MNRNMNQKEELSVNKRGAIGLALVLVSALLAGCSDPPPTPPVSQSGANAKTSAAATKAATSAFSSTFAATGKGKPDSFLDHSKGGFVNRAMESLRSAANGSTPTSNRSKALLAHDSGHTETNCAVSGTSETTITFDATASTTTIVEVANNCVELGIMGVHHFKDGTTTLKIAPNKFSITAANLTEGDRDATSTTKIMEEKINGTFSIVDPAMYTCTAGNVEKTFFPSGKMSIELTESVYKDEDTDNKAEVDEVSKITGFTADVIDAYNATTCVLTQETFTVSGTIAFTDNLVSNGDNNFSATMTNFKETTTPTTGGNKVSLMGTIAITSNCENGTVEISTVKDMFFPDMATDDCPTDGKLLVAGGGTTTAVIFTATGGVTIDEGNNGTIDKTFADCDDADVCKT